MSIIIRLQNLPWSANALDIRQYFSGLQIPEGGVHIVGGELGDAFIAFSTDEDARQAFLRSDGKIKSVQIKLMLSSRTEMQRVIEQARTQSMAAFMLPANTQVAAPLPAAVPPVIPAAVPEIKRDTSKERDSDRSRKDRRRSRTRSKSRDRRDRSRDRKDRRHRDRSRSRSRDRRDRRRRNRSTSRNRSRDKETRRRDKAKSPKREEREDNNSSFQRDSRKPIPEIWANRPAVNQPTLNIIPPASVNDGPGLLGAYPISLDPTKRNIIDNLGVNLQGRGLNGFQGNSQNNQMREHGFAAGNQPNLASRVRESWPPANVVPTGALPVALSTLQRRNLVDNFGRSIDNSQGPQGNSSRGPREDMRKEFSPRDRERPERDQKPQRTPDNRNENGGKRSRFEDIDSPPVDACVSVEPFYGSYGDVRRFFQGLGINYRGIKVINDDCGHKTGVCYVQFRDTYTKQQALKLNGQKLNNALIKIQHISDKTFEDAIDRFNPNPRMEEEKHEDQFGRSRNITKIFNKPVVHEEPQIKDFVCLQVEDLPTFVKEQDILHIFSQHPLLSLHLDVKPKGGTIAYVKFSNKEVAKQALAEKSHHVIRGKAVLVKPCKDEVFDQISKEQNVDLLEEAKPTDIGTDCLSISKLPSKTNDRDISDFFSDIGVIPTKIHLMSNNLGFTGQAYCEFETKEEASKAATKNNTVLGPHTISVLPISRAEMEGILSNSLPHPGITPGLPLAPGTPLPPINIVSPVKVVTPIKPVSSVKLDNFPKSLSFNQPEPIPKSEPLTNIKPVQEESSLKLPMPPESPQNPQPVSESPKIPSPIPLMSAAVRNPAADSHENFNGPRGAPDNQDFNGPRGGPNNRDFNGPRGGPNNRDNFNGPRGGPGPRDTRFGPRGGSRFNDDGSQFNARMNDGPRINPRFNPRGDNGPRFNPRKDEGRFNQHMDDGNMDDIPGCTVYMENVPYKAGTNEILDFFEGYNCTNNVSRRYNPNNTPSAEAKVTFYTPEDAFRAIRELHGAKIWGRPIYLRQA